MKKTIGNAYFFTFFTTLGLICPKFCLKTTPTLIFFASFLVNYSVVLKKFAKTSKNYHFLAQLVQKWGPMGSTQNRKHFFFSEIMKPDHKLSSTFYFIIISSVLAELLMFFYFVCCFFAKKCHFQS